MPILKANGINIRYETAGNGEPLLLIHGLGSCSEDWELQVEEFSRHFRVIVFDLRGHGRSDKPNTPYSMEMFARDAAELLRALGVQSAHVVGLSLGGGIAFQLVVSYPELVKTLTIVNSAPEAILRTFRQKFQLMLRVMVVNVLGLPKMATILADKLFVDPGQDALRATFIERFSRNDKKSYLSSLRAFIGWGVTPSIGEIACPTLILAADQDYTPLSMKEAYVAKIPGAQLVVISQSRHALPMERPGQFNAALQKFLDLNKA